MDNKLIAVITATIIASLVGYKLRKRNEQLLTMLVVAIFFTTLLWFIKFGLAYKILITLAELLLSGLCLMFDSLKTPEDSLMNKSKKKINKNYLPDETSSFNSKMYVDEHGNFI